VLGDDKKWSQYSAEEENGAIKTIRTTIVSAFLLTFESFFVFFIVFFTFHDKHYLYIDGKIIIHCFPCDICTIIKLIMFNYSNPFVTQQ